VTKPLPTKPGINGANVLSIPTEWDATWFRKFINNSLKGADVRNAIAGPGITITGNISSPYATISATGGGGGTGTVTSVGAGTGLTATPSPIVGAGTLAIANTAVTPGSYTSTNLTVNAQGQITAAANGSGAVAEPFNVTPDTHPAIPTGVGLGPNDEFETGSSIDTGGSRYSGATPWSPFNLGTGSTAIADGSLLFTPTVGAGVNYSGYTQPLPASGPWTYTARISVSGSTSNNLGGMLLATSTGPSSHLYLYGVSLTGAAGAVLAQRATNSTTFSANEGTGTTTGSSSGAGSPVANSAIFQYYQISLSGTTLTFSISSSGVPGSFGTVFSEAATAWLPNQSLIGIGAENQSNGNLIVICDWFRRTA
jgi:hypothetical protein